MEHDKKCEHKEKQGLMCHFMSWKGVAFVLVLAAVSYYLLTVHREHLALALPYIILLACPLMHIFGHGHGNHGHQNHKKDSE